MQKLLSTAVVLTILGITPLFAASAFADTTPMQHYNQAAISWTTQPNTKCYRIYYKESAAPQWQHAVRCKDLPATSFQYIIGYLKQNTNYTYDVRAVSNINNHETSLGIKQMLTIPQM